MSIYTLQILLFYFTLFHTFYITCVIIYIKDPYMIHIYLSKDLSQNNKVYPPFRALLLFVLHSSAFVLRPYSLMTIYWRSRWSPGISIKRPCKLSRRCNKASHRGRWSIWNIDACRKLIGGVHSLSLVRGIRLIALTQLIPRAQNDGGAISDNVTSTRVE